MAASVGHCRHGGITQFIEMQQIHMTHRVSRSTDEGGCVKRTNTVSQAKVTARELVTVLVTLGTTCRMGWGGLLEHNR